MTTTTASAPLSETNTPMLVLFCIGEYKKDAVKGAKVQELCRLCSSIYKRTISIEAMMDALSVLKHRGLADVASGENVWTLSVRGEKVYKNKKEFRKD